MTEQSSTRCAPFVSYVADVGREIAFSVAVQHWGEYLRMGLLVHVATVVIVRHVVLVFLESNALHLATKLVSPLNHLIS